MSGDHNMNQKFPNSSVYYSDTLTHCHSASCKQLVDALQERINKLTDQLGEAAWNYGEATRNLEQAVRDERQACADLARQWDVEHPDTNYGKCIAARIEMRGA